MRFKSFLPREFKKKNYFSEFCELGSVKLFFSHARIAEFLKGAYRVQLRIRRMDFTIRHFILANKKENCKNSKMWVKTPVLRTYFRQMYFSTQHTTFLFNRFRCPRIFYSFYEKKNVVDFSFDKTI